MVMTAFRTLLLWLLALVLPAQGYAASAMVLCAASHSRVAMQVVAPEAAAHPHADHDHGTQAAKAGRDPAQHDIGDATADPVSGQCSVCASCCHQMAIAATPLVLERTPLTCVYAGTSFGPSASVYPNGLERPPRSVLA